MEVVIDEWFCLLRCRWWLTKTVSMCTVTTFHHRTLKPADMHTVCKYVDDHLFFYSFTAVVD